MVFGYMVWLTIIFVVLMAISPIFWMRNTPQQKRIEKMRMLARANGIQVALHKRPDAREGETRLETVCYKLPWRVRHPRKHEVLHRNSNRGWKSDLKNWRWISGDTIKLSGTDVELVIDKLPVTVSAVMLDSCGVGLIWNEFEGEEMVPEILERLQSLRSFFEKKSPNT